MKAARIRKKNEKDLREELTEEYSFYKFFIIMLFVILFISIFLIITTFVVKKDDASTNKSEEKVEINSNTITLNQLLNRKEKEYYVIAIKPSSYVKMSGKLLNYSDLYSEKISAYKQKEDSLQIYYIDLDSAFNKKFVGEENIITNELSNLKISDEVLFKIKNGSIAKSYIGSEKILSELNKISKTEED